MASSHDLLEVRQLARRVREQYSGEHGRAEQRPGQLLQVSVPEAQHALDRQLEQASDNMPGLREAQQQLQVQQQYLLLLQQPLQEHEGQHPTDSCGDAIATTKEQQQQQQHPVDLFSQPDSQCTPGTDPADQGEQSGGTGQHAAVRPCSAPVRASQTISAQSCQQTSAQATAGSNDGRSVTHVAPWTELPPSYWAQHGLTLEQQLKQGGYESNGYDIKKTYVTASSSVQRVARPHNFTMSPDEVLRRELQAMRDADKHLLDVRENLQALEAGQQQQQQRLSPRRQKPSSSSCILQLERDMKASSSMDQQHAGSRCMSAATSLRCTSHRPSSAPAASSSSKSMIVQQQLSSGACQLQSFRHAMQPVTPACVQRPVASPGQVSLACQISRSHSGSTVSTSRPQSGSTMPASRPHSGGTDSASRPRSGSTGLASRPHSGGSSVPAGSVRPGSAGLSRLGPAACGGVEQADMLPTATNGRPAVAQTIWEGCEEEEEALPVEDLLLTADDMEPALAPAIAPAGSQLPLPQDAEQPVVAPAAVGVHRPVSAHNAGPVMALARPCSAGRVGAAAGKSAAVNVALVAAGRPAAAGVIVASAGRCGTADSAAAAAAGMHGTADLAVVAAGRPASARPPSGHTAAPPAAVLGMMHTTTTARPATSQSNAQPQQSSPSTYTASSTRASAGQLQAPVYITSSTLSTQQPGLQVTGNTTGEDKAAMCIEEDASTAPVQEAAAVGRPSVMLTAYSRVNHDCKSRPWSAPCLRPFKPCLHTYVPICTSSRDPAAPATPVGRGNTAVGFNAVSGLRNVRYVQGNKLMQPTLACLGKYATHRQCQHMAIPTHGGRDSSSIGQSIDNMCLQKSSYSDSRQARQKAASISVVSAKRQPASAALQATKQMSGTAGATTITMLRDNTTFVMPSDMMQRMLRTYRQLN